MIHLVMDWPVFWFVAGGSVGIGALIYASCPPRRPVRRPRSDEQQ